MSPTLKKGKVGFLGCSPSFLLAPSQDPEWDLWACGPAMRMYPDARERFDRWFELHDMLDNDPQYGNVLDPGYFEWLEETAKTNIVYYRPPLYEGVKGEKFPWDAILKKHSGYFLDSTVAWMMAYAYEFADVTEIGLWGIDFASEKERVAQRKGTKHFIELFKLRGIPCYIPPQSEMAFDPEPYPDVSELSQNLDGRLKQLGAEKSGVEKSIEAIKASLEEQYRSMERVSGSIESITNIKDNYS